MKYGVIVCSKCKKAKGVMLSSKTTKCIRCGKILYLDKVKIFYKTNSEYKLRQSLGIINAKLDNNLEYYRKQFS